MTRATHFNGFFNVCKCCDFATNDVAKWKHHLRTKKHGYRLPIYEKNKEPENLIFPDQDDNDGNEEIKTSREYDYYVHPMTK